MAKDFKAKRRIASRARAYALHAIWIARDTYDIRLDWSDDSVEKVETILGDLHDDLLDWFPTDEELLETAAMFGSYVGEVYRKNHGATWGIVTLDGESIPGMRTDRSETNFWPWDRARRRIVNGPEDNIWHYYRVLVDEYTAPQDDSEETTESKSTDKSGRRDVHAKKTPKNAKPWWKKLFGV
jgi:hypothetical protein